MAPRKQVSAAQLAQAQAKAQAQARTQPQLQQSSSQPPTASTSKAVASTASETTAQTTTALRTLGAHYKASTAPRLQFLDAILGVLALMGALQFVYCATVNSRDFGTFVAGFGANVGAFVVIASLRIQAASAISSSRSSAAQGGISASASEGSAVFKLVSQERCVPDSRSVQTCARLTSSRQSLRRLCLRSRHLALRRALVPGQGRVRHHRTRHSAIAPTWNQTYSRP